MARLVFITVLLVLCDTMCCEASGRRSKKEVASAFEASKIVPDVVSVAPPALVEVSYDQYDGADLGNEISPLFRPRFEPEYISYETEPDSYYTLVFTDPDGPKPGKGEFQHWLVGNIPESRVKDGQVLSQYIGPWPSEDSGLHRYVFLVFKQPGRLEFSEPNLYSYSLAGRSEFSTKKFAEKYGLGDPIAGNFYRSQYNADQFALFLLAHEDIPDFN